MWSDRPSGKRRERLVRRLRAILPAPRPGARGSKTPLRISGPKGPPDPERVAEELREQPGFSWLDGAGDGHRFHVRPLATLAVRGGRATVSGPGGRATFAAAGFDLLDAAFAAWGGEGAGAHAGGLSWLRAGGELESLPAPSEDDLGLPDLHLSLYDAALRWDGGSWTLEATDAWREPAVLEIRGDPGRRPPAERSRGPGRPAGPRAGRRGQPSPPGRLRGGGDADRRAHRLGRDLPDEPLPPAGGGAPGGPSLAALPAPAGGQPGRSTAPFSTWGGGAPCSRSRRSCSSPRAAARSSRARSRGPGRAAPTRGRTGRSPASCWRARRTAPS